MANIYGFGLDVYGPKEMLQLVADCVDSQCSEEGYIHEESKKPLRSWACLYGKCELDGDGERLFVQGEAKNGPALFLAEMISTRFPEVRVLVSGSDEDGVGECWELKADHARLWEFSHSFDFDTFGVTDYEVKDGFKLSREERVACVYDEFVRLMAEQKDDEVEAPGPSQVITAERTPEEWKAYIREQLHDVLPMFLDEKHIREIPQHEGAKND